ncbi:hypothetical protein R1flu_018561 [Riccia fluitans]|uniref:Uncharacterized protein n=1 Tax=Riccia fluitans TaxID=41844 RepID=A0ABD1ZGC9_9MARC
MSSSRNLEEQLEVTQRENELLKEKLTIHLDRWSFDRTLLQEMADERGLESAEQLYKIAQVGLHHGVEFQKNLVLQAQLDSARGEVEILKLQVLELKSALEVEKKKQITPEKLKKLKRAMQEKFIHTAKKKCQEWKTVFESKHRGYLDSVQKMKEKHRANVEQLKGKIHHLASELGELKTEQEQWKLDKRGLQDLASEKDKLQEELEKVRTSLEEKNRKIVSEEQDAQELDVQKERVMVEAERWKSEKQEIQVLLEEREKLLEEKRRWGVKEHEMEELALERQKIFLQRDEWRSQEKELHELKLEMGKLLEEKLQWTEKDHEMQELALERGKQLQQLTVERDQLKRRLHGKESEEFYSSLKDKEQLEVVRSQRDNLIREREKLETVRSQRDSLYRERDFVWNQMKQMEEDYTKKLIASSKQLAQATQEISTLKRDLQLAQAASNEKMVEMTVLKLEAKRAEEDRKQLNEALAALKQVSNAGKSTQFRTNSKRNGKDENLDHEGSVNNKRSPYELTAQIKMLQAELKASLEGGLLPSSNDRQEVFSPDDLATWDTLVSHVEQAERMDVEDGMKCSKYLEELRRENENLRVMYGQLEALYKEKQPQKPEKVTRSMARKDPTSRNLKTELEAAAALSPLKEGPALRSGDGQRKVLQNFSTSLASQRRGSDSKVRGSISTSAHETTLKELREHTGPDLPPLQPDMSESSTKRAVSSRPRTRSLSNRKPSETNLMEHQDDGLPKLSTRKRKANSTDGDEETQRVPLLPVAVNEGSYTSGKKAKRQSSRKPETGSLEGRTKSSAKENSCTRVWGRSSSIFRLSRAFKAADRQADGRHDPCLTDGGMLTVLCGEKVTRPFFEKLLPGRGCFKLQTSSQPFPFHDPFSFVIIGQEHSPGSSCTMYKPTSTGSRDLFLQASMAVAEYNVHVVEWNKSYCKKSATAGQLVREGDPKKTASLSMAKTWTTAQAECWKISTLRTFLVS